MVTGSKKAESGALSLYVGDGHRAAVEAIGTYHLELPSGLVIVLNNCHYAPSITRVLKASGGMGGLELIQGRRYKILCRHNFDHDDDDQEIDELKTIYARKLKVSSQRDASTMLEKTAHAKCSPTLGRSRICVQFYMEVMLTEEVQNKVFLNLSTDAEIYVLLMHQEAIGFENSFLVVGIVITLKNPSSMMCTYWASNSEE
ncbi:hypothetical protein Tco_0602442 [Tanacetum coccineum]